MNDSGVEGCVNKQGKFKQLLHHINLYKVCIFSLFKIWSGVEFNTHACS